MNASVRTPVPAAESIGAPYFRPGHRAFDQRERAKRRSVCSWPRVFAVAFVTGRVELIDPTECGARRRRIGYPIADPTDGQTPPGRGRPRIAARPRVDSRGLPDPAATGSRQAARVSGQRL